MSANLKSTIMVIVTNIAITVKNPALSPSTFIKSSNPSSGVVGAIISETENFAGIANLKTFAIALIENNINKITEAALACRFKLGNRVRRPFARIAPWKIPIPKTIAKEIRKFSWANSIIPMIKNSSHYDN